MIFVKIRFNICPTCPHSVGMEIGNEDRSVERQMGLMQGCDTVLPDILEVIAEMPRAAVQTEFH
jgi:hypothetical protein